MNKMFHDPSCIDTGHKPVGLAKVCGHSGFLICSEAAEYLQG